MSYVLESNWGELSSAGQDDTISPTQTPPLGPSAFYSDSLDDAIRSAERLLILAAQGSLLRAASATQHEDAATNIATILRAVLTVAKTHQIPLQSCVLRRIRLLALEHPMPDRLLVEVSSVGAVGQTEGMQRDDQSDITPIGVGNEKPGPSLSASQLPPIGLQGITRAALSSGTSSGSQHPMSHPSQTLDDVPGEGPSMNASNRHASSSSFDDMKGNGTNGTGSTLQTTATGSSAPLGARQRPLIHLVSRASPQSDHQSDHQPTQVHSPPVSQTHTALPSQVQQPRPQQLQRRPQQTTGAGVGSGGGRTTVGGSTHLSSTLMSSPSSYHPQHVVSYIDEVLIGEDTPLCDPASATLRGSKGRDDGDVDPIHAEYLRDGAWLPGGGNGGPGSALLNLAPTNNTSFVAISPMTPADLLRQSLCDQIPGAAHSLSSLKQSYRELQNHSFQSTGAVPSVLNHIHNSPLDGAHMGPSTGRARKQRISHPTPINHTVVVPLLPPVMTSLSANTSHDNLASLSQTQDSGDLTPGAGGGAGATPSTFAPPRVSPTTLVPPISRREESPQPMRPPVVVSAPRQTTSSVTLSRARSSVATQYVSLTSRTIPFGHGHMPRVAYGLELLRQVTSE